MRHAGDNPTRAGTGKQSLAVSVPGGATNAAGAAALAGAPADPLAATVARMRALAEQAGDALLTEGPVHPDHKLLDGCAAVLPLLVKAQQARKARARYLWHRLDGEELRAAQVEDDSLARTHIECDQRATPMLRRLTKLRATTPAGIYAKALVVRASRTGAACLAMSLAQDLVACPALRATLWPAGQDGGT